MQENAKFKRVSLSCSFLSNFILQEDAKNLFIYFHYLNFEHIFYFADQHSVYNKTKLYETILVIEFKKTIMFPYAFIVEIG